MCCSSEDGAGGVTSRASNEGCASEDGAVGEGDKGISKGVVTGGKDGMQNLPTS